VEIVLGGGTKVNVTVKTATLDEIIRTADFYNPAYTVY
jgi:D-3-phosphoglycerate dehydrogenase